MRIAVCENNAAERAKLCGLIRTYCERNSLSAEVHGFDTGTELLHRMRQTPFSIVFLDVILGEESGIKTAHAIRRHYEDCILFFWTSSKQYALESYELNALHYLLKPIEYGKLESAMARCGDRLRAEARTMLVSIKPEIKILVRDILFVEIYDKNCHIHTGGDVFTMRRTIGQLGDELGKTPFLRCHRSFIVNMEHVREYDRADFILKNGERVPIRQTGRSGIKQAFRDYSRLG
ncbi:MAG: LytTR family DNA-binding domain-containing protein [Oscillospiraceae bacterium]|nr:LytTR family DNA-binding domain-containing protein [Oscillospiraceae bacterium]